MFSTIPITNFNILAAVSLSSANAFNLDLSENLLFGNELNRTQMMIFSPENVVGKGAKSRLSEFFFIQSFQMPSLSDCFKIQVVGLLVVLGLNPFPHNDTF